MAKGIIYIMTTSVNGLIKIGKTDSFKKRKQFLEQNGYWNVTGLKMFYAVRVDDYDRKEKLIHTMFSKSQVANSELFALDKHIARELLESFNGQQIFPEITDMPVKREKSLSKVVSKKVDEKTGTTEKTKHIAAKLLLKNINIKNGSKLVYDKDPAITCTVVDNTKNIVEYKGNQYTMSGFVKFLNDGKGEWQGSRHLLYKGKRIVDWRKEMNI